MDERARSDVTPAGDARPGQWPTVTVVFVAYDRREALRLSLSKTLDELDYDSDRLDVIVVDNASTDGTAEMVASEFPGVRLIERSWNCGASAWNDGFAVATGEYVLVLDDDCHLPQDGLRQAVAQADAERADLVSFGVKSSVVDTYRFDIDQYPTGLLSFWGCAWLVRREVLRCLGGYDPQIFMWANELEFILRFFDLGFRHLYLPEVVAVHAKAPDYFRPGHVSERPYRINAHNFGYIAAKLFQPRDAVEALLALLAHNLGAGLRVDKVALKALPDTVRGFMHGLRHRKPVRPEVSRTYRRNFETFASPWRISPPARIPWRRALDRRSAAINYRTRRDRWIAERARFYPRRQAVLEL